LDDDSALLESICHGESTIDSQLLKQLVNDGNTSSILSLGEMDSAHEFTSPLVRVHSCCATGDNIGSMRCDCRTQMEKAVKTIADFGYGAMFYVANHEGRGIGLFAKAMTYLLQDDGYDTYAANQALGLPTDGRNYQHVAHLLKYFYENKSINILSNNPDKIKSVSDYGVDVVSRVEIFGDVKKQNERYLQTKQALGHLLNVEAQLDSGRVSPLASARGVTK
jgi:GTP cyclohydrolase II